MTIGTNFVRGINPVWSFVDLNGFQFNDTFYMYVLENEIPYIPATVYHDDSGNIPWTNPIQFLANGTLPIDIFWNEDIVYRLEFRQNLGLLLPSQNDPLIYLVENYIPTGSIVIPTTVSGSTTENQITNGQFSLVNFVSPLMLTGVTNPPSIEIAPGWFLDLVGTGNVELQQVPLNSTIPSPTNAPYALRITLTGGWTSLPVLRQRFYQNGVNWANKYLSTSLTAICNGPPPQIMVGLSASNGQPLGTLIPATTLSNSFQQYTGFDFIVAYTNNDTPPNAYIDYKVFLPITGDIYLTSFQLIASDEMGNLDYEQDTINRQIDHTFHYYKPKLSYKPIPSFLVGWDFPLNPAQINGSTVAASAIGANKSQYAWDQTIVFQSVDSGVGVTRSSAGAIRLTAAQTGQFAVVQYLDQPQATKLLNDAISVFVSSATNNSMGYTATVSLYYTTDANLPNVAPGTNNSLILTIDANGVPATFNDNWFPVPRGTLGSASFTVNQGTTAKPFNNNMFSAWNLMNTTIADSATFFAVVIGFQTITMNDYIDIYSVGLCSGDIATSPAPKTQDEVLRDCERYYEQSYDLGVLPTAITATNQLSFVQTGTAGTGGGTTSMQITTFGFEYRTLKRVNHPILAVYSPTTGTVGMVHSYAVSAATVQSDVAISNWTVTNGSKYSNCLSNSQSLVNTGLFGTITTPAICSIIFHYVLDARLGIVN